MYNVPVLLIMFNRPDAVEKMLDRLSQVKPSFLFVAADGPRKNKEGEQILTDRCRRLISEGVTWPCQLLTLYRTENVGSKRSVSGAIDWLFQHVDHGIILEDDCLPSASFFPYCEFLLNEYRDDERIMMISGFNALGKWNEKHLDYFFSDGSIWGWATWKRAWQKFDVNATHFLDHRNDPDVAQKLSEFPMLVKGLEEVLASQVDAWDYQWWYTRVVNNGLAVTPAINLIENIGFNAQATHTKWVNHPHKNNKARSLRFPLRTNPVIERDSAYAQKVLQKENKIPSRVQSLKARVIDYLLARFRK